MNFAQVIKILISHGADVTRQNSFGRTALHIAADWDNDEVAKLLLDHAEDRGVFLQLKDESGRRAVDYAVSEELKQLLDEETTVDKDSTDNRGDRRRTTRKMTIAKPVPDEFEVDPIQISVGSRIGVGGTAEVFRGNFRGTDVAIKRMYFDGKSMPAHVEAFKREINTMANCRHPNLVLMMGAVTRSLPLTLVTELCRGGSLYELLYTQKFKLTRKQQVKVALDISRALNYLHTQKPPIIHRDCKSLNALLLEPVK
ncbi:protein kinase, partial [Perkinsus sp. BL_2016]